MLSEIEGVSNTAIICQDGIVYSHKLVVASFSSFIKYLVTPIPANDDISLILPDFKVKDVEDLINENVFNGKFNTELGT